MVVIDSFTTAIIMCIITMICWGSHANALKLLSKSYAYSYYYWDQAIGYLLLPLLLAFTMGSIGDTGRSFIADLTQGSGSAFMWAILGGFVFNLANILFVASVDIAGMAVAFPIGIGIALVEGVVINYIASPKGNPVLIFIGVALIMAAILVNAGAYSKLQSTKDEGVAKSETRKAIILAFFGGILMGLFYYLLQRSMSTEDFNNLEPGKFSPYTAVVVFAFASLISNFIFNSYIMSHPFKGKPVKYSGYIAKGHAKDHIVSLVSGCVNSLGTSFNIIASGVVGAAIAYGLGQSAPMIAAVWGVFVWKEFKSAPKGTNKLIVSMFILFLAGLLLLIISKIE